MVGWRQMVVELRARILAQVSQEDEFLEGKLFSAGTPGQPGRLGLSCGQQAPKPAHQPAGTSYDEVQC